VVSVVATVREAPAVPADRVGSPAPLVAVPHQSAVRPNRQTVRSIREEAESDDA